MFAGAAKYEGPDDHSESRFRSSALFDTDTDPEENGAINWTYA